MNNIETRKIFVIMFVVEDERMLKKVECG
jgi:hypothetical protein